MHQTNPALHVLNNPSVVRRPRHWKQLMTVTGQQFELDLKTFTLGNMFAMQLQSHATAIASITNGALKELTIENDLKKIADVWKEQRFELHKYNHVSGKTAPGAGSDAVVRVHVGTPLPLLGCVHCRK
jgi:hypothetical protein